MQFMKTQANFCMFWKCRKIFFGPNTVSRLLNTIHNYYIQPKNGKKKQNTKYKKQ